MKRSRSQFRWPLPLTSALLSLLGMTAGTAAIARDSLANSDGAALSVIDDAGISMGVGDDLYLEVVVNQQPTGQLAHFGERNGQLWASHPTLHQLGIIVPSGSPDPMLLRSLPGAIVQYDAARQRVSITAPLPLLDLQTEVLNANDGDTVPHANASPGLLLNYDMYGTAGDHGSGSINAYTELRAFSGSGVFSNTMLSQAIRQPGKGWRTSSVRLDSSWQTSFPEQMLSLRVGDTLTGALGWSRSTHIGGVQLSRNFTLQPYRITTPLPTFMGQAATPSAVDLYINGIKQYSGKVAPGPFQINSAPSISGSGNAQVVLTDAMGRSNTIDFPFYASEQLLQKGLFDWSAEVGVIRKNYGLNSFDYGHDPAASGTLRYGVGNGFTAQGHVEATAGLTLAGIGGNLLLGSRGGVLNAAAARSQGHDANGSLYDIGYQWHGGAFNFSVASTRTSGRYRDVASLYGAPPPSVSERALVGYGTQGLGNFSLSYLHLRYPGYTIDTSYLPTSPYDYGDQPIYASSQDSRYASAFWFRSLGHRMSLSLSVNQNLDDQRDRSIFLGFSMSLDDRTQLSASAQRNGDSNSFVLDANHSVPSDTGFGWRAQARSGGGQGGLAEGTYRGIHGQVAAGVSAYGDSHYVYADANGALVLMGGHTFAARQISDAFAVVSTDGIADVPVTLENRPIGRTNAAGMLLVTPLNAWQKNQLAIDPMDLPADVRIDHVKTLAVPSDRAGTLVRFGVTPIRAASIVLVDIAGKPLPLGSHVRIAGQKDNNAMIGFDGAVYLDTLDAYNTLNVDTPQGSCHVSFDYQMQGGGIPEIGPLTCLGGTGP